jgi:hypothetical protein
MLSSPAWSRPAAPTAGAPHRKFCERWNEEQINAAAALIDAAATGVEQIT